jgi:hypothetical protein
MMTWRYAVGFTLVTGGVMGAGINITLSATGPKMRVIKSDMSM